jgi:diguanylate cyclase (GGDEF)-like protein
MNRLLFTLVILSAGINITVALLAWRRRNAISAKAFVALMAAFAVYSFGYAFELADPTLNGKLFWIHVEYAAIPFLPAFWLLMVFQYAGYTFLLRKRFVALIFLIPAVIFAAVHTNQYHHLFYAATRLSTDAPFPSLSFVSGPLYQLHMVYTNFAIAVGDVIYLSLVLNTKSIYRKQAAIMLGGTLLPWAVYGAYILALIPWHLDPNPFTFSVVGLVYALGLFKYRMLELVPMARATVFDRMKNGILVFDSFGSLIDFNRASTIVFPFLSSASIGQHAACLFSSHKDLLFLYEDTAHDSGDIRIEHENRQRVYSVSISAVSRRNTTLCRIFEFGEITRQADLLEKMKAIASIDELTGIWNRRFLLELGGNEIARILRTKRAATVIIADIDHFKKINDTYGHSTGDLVLKKFSAYVSGCLRGSDIFGRYGGEEFVIIFPETPPKIAMEIAHRIKAGIEAAAFGSDDTPIRVTASFGIYGEELLSSVCTINEMIELADRALYRAKAGGRNCVCLESPAEITPKID